MIQEAATATATIANQPNSGFPAINCWGFAMKLTLTEDEKRQVQDGVRRVIAGEKKWDAPELHFPSMAIIRVIAEIDGIVDTEDFRANGWQWDWWQDFIFDGRRYTLSGSGAYGGHEFFVADEQ